MAFACSLSTRPDTAAAAQEAADQALAQLGGAPQLAFLFHSTHHAANADQLVAQLRQRLPADCVLLGCTGESIVGNDREIEESPALTLWLARWSAAVQLEPFHLSLEKTVDGYSLIGYPDGLFHADVQQSVVFVLADPFSVPIEAFLQQMNEIHPKLRVLGGMASGARSAGENALIQGDKVHRHGAVGVLLQGPVGIRGIVSQGCRPIGRPLVITRAEQNIILELGGVPPLERLQELWQQLSEADQQLVQQGLHIGRVINEYQEDFQRGDFLVRNVMGLDRRTGAMAITDHVRVGQTVQFHVRDAATADEDLHALLQLDLSAQEKPPAGALVFTCNGRGTRLFDGPHHDASVIRGEAGPLPLAGFFAQGELGPIGGQNFIHGFTASVVLFEEG